MIMKQRGHNLYFASLSSKLSRFFGLASRGNYRPGEEELSYVQYAKDYFVKARKGEQIKKMWLTEGFNIGSETEEALSAYDELCHCLNGWDEESISQIENILRGFYNLDSSEAKFAQSFFLNLAQESLKNPVYRSCFG